MANRGLFITFEGGDGVGKSTQLNRLAAWFSANTGRDIVTSREPGGTELGKKLRAEILHGENLSSRTEALLYAADRAHHVASLVRPALESGAVVISDRYLDSSVAYQAGGRKLEKSEVEQLSLWAVEGLLPDITILLDADRGVSRQRVAVREAGGEDRMERAGDEFHERTRQEFLSRAAEDPERWLVIAADQSVEEVFEDVVSAVAKKLLAIGWVN